MITKVKDINGEDLKVGDKVAWGNTTSSYNAVICYGEIVNILKKSYQTRVEVKVIKRGGWWPREGSIKTFIYPRNYHNIIKL